MEGVENYISFPVFFKMDKFFQFRLRDAGSGFRPLSKVTNKALVLA